MKAAFLKKVKKKAYGYDSTGQVGEISGTQGVERNLQDINEPENDYGTGNPVSNMLVDGDAIKDFPFLKNKGIQKRIPSRTSSLNKN